MTTNQKVNSNAEEINIKNDGKKIKGKIEVSDGSTVNIRSNKKYRVADNSKGNVKVKKSSNKPKSKTNKKPSKKG